MSKIIRSSCCLHAISYLRIKIITIPFMVAFLGTRQENKKKNKHSLSFCSLLILTETSLKTRICHKYLLHILIRDRAGCAQEKHLTTNYNIHKTAQKFKSYLLAITKTLRPISVPNIRYTQNTTHTHPLLTFWSFH